MRIRLIYPKFKKFLEDHAALKQSLEKYIVGDYTMPPSLALPIIAALTPDDIEVNLTDDNINQPIDYDESVDLVAISCFTPQAQRAYTIADEFRKRGTRTIIGGIHPTAMPQEALEHAETVCVGEVEAVWAEVLHDLRAGELKKLYSSSSVYNLENFPIPQREIFPHDTYKWNAHLVLTMRGCPVKCIGCPIPFKEDIHFRYRPVKNIIDDIVQMPYKEFYITDDTVMLPGKKNKKFLLQLMEQTKGLDIKIFLASTMMMEDDESFYKKLKEGGANQIYTIFGFDRNSQQLLSKECQKDFWKKEVELVRMIEASGIHFFGSFGIGFDNQDRAVVDRILRFCDETGLDLAEFYILTPFPGTPFGNQMVQENRILHRNYSLWNHANVVFRPRNWTIDELADDFQKLWLDFYKNKDPEKTLRSFELGDQTN